MRICFNLHRGDFNLSNFEDGVLSSAFMVGLLVASPIFASLAKRCGLDSPKF
jgi:fucose permease